MHLNSAVRLQFYFLFFWSQVFDLLTDVVENLKVGV